MPWGDLCDGGGVHLGVLANVERLQVQAVGANLQQQRIDQHLGEAVAAVLDEGVAQSVRSESRSAARVYGASAGLAGRERWTEAWLRDAS